MPFAIWCTTCKPHETIIGQGVRFNAEKKKIGNYYSTPIYSFRMKHTACGGWIEIRTDPENTAYVVHEGARKRDTGDDREIQPGEIAIRLPGDSQDPAEKDPFAKLEGKTEDKRRSQSESGRILELQERQARDWDDPYAQSRRLRKTFRTERKGLETLEASRDSIKEKMSLGIDIVDETEEDRQRAGFIDFGDDQNFAEARASQMMRAKPMFEQSCPRAPSEAMKRDRIGGSQRRKNADDTAHRIRSLRQELTGNTRVAVDPFLHEPADNENSWKTGMKRKKVSSTSKTPDSKTRDSPSVPLKRLNAPSDKSPPALVSYVSDSE